MFETPVDRRNFLRGSTLFAAAIGLAMAAFIALVRLKWPLLLIIGLSAAIGAVYYLLLRS